VRIAIRTAERARWDQDIGMSTRRIIATMGMLLCAAQPLGARDRACITNLGDGCLARCVGAFGQECGFDAVCHQDLAAVLRALARTSDENDTCAAAIVDALAACDCD
jgi:hypothetical protein